MPRRLLALAALALAARAAAAVQVVDAGALRAEVTPDPWRIVFRDPTGADVLAEATDLGPSPSGPLGFRTAAGWVHAVRATSLRRDGRALLATVATTDPLGRTLAVRIAPDADGVVAVEATLAGATDDVEALGIGFDAHADERFFGLGERATGAEHRGEVVESYVADGPWQPEEYPFVSLFVPRPGFRPRDDATYFPLPWVLSSRGVGVLVDVDDVVVHRLASERAEAWSVEIAGVPEGVTPPRPAPTRLAFRVFAGPTPADALRRFSARIGRQPPVGAPWVLGPWFQGPLTALATLQAADAPVSVLQTYAHYLPCGVDRSGQPPLAGAAHAAGVAITTYFNPMVCESYAHAFAPAKAAGALTRTASGEPYLYDYTGSRIFHVGQLDFTTDAARTLWAGLVGEAVADGHDGWMEDFGEYTPLDAVAADGATGAAGHDRYVVGYHCASWDAVRRLPKPVVRFQRSGWTGAARCAQVVWGGDPSTSWGFDGLASVVRAGLGLGLSGVSTWGSDVGGFFGLGDRHLDGELLQRWVQVGMVSGVMRTERDGFGFPSYVRPQVDDPAQIPNWRRYAKLRTQLYPYLAAADAAYQRSGLPIMRHLVLTWPDVAAAQTRDDEFLFGPDLLAAPVLAPGVSARDVWLPPGTWVDLWRSVTWDDVAGTIVPDAAVLLAGDRTVTVPAPLDELPLLVRAGAILPLLPADVATLADYGAGTPGVVRLADRAAERRLLAWPRGRSTADLGPRERAESSVDGDVWTLRLRSRRVRTWTLEASLAALEQPLVPSDLRWRGHTLAPEAWSWDAASRVLRVTLRGRGGLLVVRGRR